VTLSKEELFFLWQRHLLIQPSSLILVLFVEPDSDPLINMHFATALSSLALAAGVGAQTLTQVITQNAAQLSSLASR
jgi:hypothetical protein